MEDYYYLFVFPFIKVFPHLLELEDLRRQAGLLEDGEVKQTALSRLSRHMTITNAIASLHDKAVLGAVMAVHKGRVSDHHKLYFALSERSSNS
jgi:hypothetical protein